MSGDSIKQITKNKKAFHDYFVEESFEAGVVLVGTEVKSLRKGTVNMQDGWCAIDDGEMFMKGVHISPYEHGNRFNEEPRRERKLLLHKKQIMHLLGVLKQKGYTLIPLSMYFKGSNVKVQIGLCVGKKLYDKREDAARKDMKRAVDRALKERNY